MSALDQIYASDSKIPSNLDKVTPVIERSLSMTQSLNNKDPLTACNTPQKLIQKNKINYSLKDEVSFTQVSNFLESTSNFKKHYEDIVKSLNDCVVPKLRKQNSVGAKTIKTTCFQDKNHIINEFTSVDSIVKEKKSQSTSFLTKQISNNGQSLLQSIKNSSIVKSFKENENQRFPIIGSIKEYYEYIENSLLMIPKIKSIQQENKFIDDIILPEELRKRKIAIFDLDEILIHCEYENISEADKIIDLESDFNGNLKIGINIRPHLYECLARIKNNFVLVLYTTSDKTYADTILNFIDPHDKLFSYKFYRQNCTKYQLNNETIYIKNPKIFSNVSDENIIFVDKSVLSIAFNLSNVVPILPFYNNKNDKELQNLVNYLEYLMEFNNIKFMNEKYMKLAQYIKKRLDPEICLDVESIDDGSFEFEDSNFFENSELSLYLNRENNRKIIDFSGES